MPFPGIPIVFSPSSIGLPGVQALDSDFTGVENDQLPAETLAVALRLQPGAQHVAVVNGGIAAFDREQLAFVKTRTERILRPSRHCLCDKSGHA